MMDLRASAHAESTLATWIRLQNFKKGKEKIILDGNSLDIASLVAVARYGVKPTISQDEDLARRIALSVDALAEYLSHKYVVYGVNTGFGGSADVRTDDWLENQIGVLQHTQSAIITSSDRELGSETSHVMPREWVRGAIVARANQNMRGQSSVRLEVLERLVSLLHHDITPLVPIRGTISASGDLMPMSYIAGAVTGNPDIFVQVGKGKSAKVMPSHEALQKSGLSPSGLGPKEALGLINGTAPSASVASLVMHESQQLALLAQVLTAFASESMGGNVEWTAPFIHAVRPHPGQIEAAANIRSFLHGSKFVVGLEDRKRTGDGLWQDRYSTRTSPQWIGPYLEDLLLAQRQISIELNSTSDNPLVDASEKDGKAVGEVYSGGNFQAVAITSAMDKTRLALQMIGRMLFSQVSEMINPSTNNGLEANLNVSDKENFTMKGIDVNMSAYMSELAALAHPVSSHVMSAEMHNQGINSLALLSARRTMEAADLVAHMCACHIYVSCQAVEVRASHRFFLETLHDKLLNKTKNGPFHAFGLDEVAIEKLGEEIFPVVEKAWYENNAGCWKDRIIPTVDAAMAPVTQFLTSEEIDCPISSLAVFRGHFHKSVVETVSSIFYPNMAVRPVDVVTELGDGTARLYAWVRLKLGVPTQCGIDDDPLYNAEKGQYPEGKKTIGSWVSMVYESLKDDMIDVVVMEGIANDWEGPESEDEYEELCQDLKATN
ncbi:L-Aspartase-like protein [Fusarium flagelliforme]|uniref:L-Aspartase-like protein n=1 Tax=Fusarium flagelliforme TaxID=2675880 RepID=UPI001E8DF9A4|nr:L-Aspartase-like protein [Fusarium flagelliforme]KAH7179359.1 L-Aspartase-like protein [Fusarium flagelliforme]